MNDSSKTTDKITFDVIPYFIFVFSLLILKQTLIEDIDFSLICPEC